MIEEYDFGRIVIDGQVYRRDLLILPDRIVADWWRTEGHELAVTDLADVLADPPEVLVVGSGAYGRLVVLPETERALTARQVQLITQPTDIACQTYNQMAAAGRRVVAALHLTC